MSTVTAVTCPSLEPRFTFNLRLSRDSTLVPVEIDGDERLAPLEVYMSTLEDLQNVIGALEAGVLNGGTRILARDGCFYRLKGKDALAILQHHMSERDFPRFSLDLPLPAYVQECFWNKVAEILSSPMVRVMLPGNEPRIKSHDALHQEFKRVLRQVLQAETSASKAIRKHSFFVE